MNKNIFKLIAIAIVFALQVQAEVPVNYPDLSDAKTIIIERQKELFEHLQEVIDTGSNYIKSEAYGKLAQFYYVHEYVDASIPFYLNAIELAPMNSKWYYLLGIAYKSKGIFEKAISVFEKSWELNSEYLPNMEYLGEVYLQQGALEKAKIAFNTILKQDKKFSRALVSLGQVLMQEGEAEKAIQKYKKALNYQPSANQINFLLSSAYAALGDMKTSKEYFAKKGLVQAQMYDPIIIALYKESRSYTYYNNKAIQAYKEGDYINAEKLAILASKYAPNSPYPKVTLANIYVSTDRVQLAVNIMEKAVKENPANSNFQFILGVIEGINANYDKSIHWYRSALKINRYHKKALLNLSNALMRKGQYDEALTQLQLLQNLDPENPDVLHKQASIYAHQKKCNLAVDKIYLAVKNQPKSFKLLLTLVKIAVHCPVEKQVLTDALNAARNIYQYSQDIYVVETLAMIEAKNNNFDEAIDYQAQAIFQLLLDKDSNDTEKIKKLKLNLELYKKGKYPIDLFGKIDVDLNPSSFLKIK